MQPDSYGRPQQDMGQMASAMVEAWQLIAKHSADIAHARRTLFDAYVAEGFTEAQALELIKQP